MGHYRLTVDKYLKAFLKELSMINRLKGIWKSLILNHHHKARIWHLNREQKNRYSTEKSVRNLTHMNAITHINNHLLMKRHHWRYQRLLEIVQESLGCAQRKMWRPILMKNIALKIIKSKITTKLQRWNQKSIRWRN